MTHPLPNQQGSELDRLIEDLILGVVGKKLEAQGYILLPAQAELFANYILQDRRSTARDVCQAIVSSGPKDKDHRVAKLVTDGFGQEIQCNYDQDKALVDAIWNRCNAKWRQAITEVEKEYE